MGENMVPISHITNIVLGGTPKRNNPGYWGGQIKWASAKDVVNTNTRYIFDTEETITALGLNESNTKLLPKDTIVITARGTVGSMAMLGEPMCFNQTCYGLTAKEGVDQTYLFFALKASIANIHSVSYGTVFNTITMKSFDSIEIPLPSIEEQQRIADILGTLDDKIELNRQMNHTLEAMARAIFKSWFVDFDPVYAKIEGREYPLPSDVMDLFPDELVESELGLIPKGWKVGELKDGFNLTMGQSPPGSTYNEDEDGLPFYQGRRDFGFRYPALRVYCNAPKRIANPNDSLVSVRAPVGDLNMAKEKCCIGRGVAAVRHKTGSASFTYYSMLKLKDYFNLFESEGTVFGSIGKKDFEGLEVIMPPNEMVKAFEEIVGIFDKKIENDSLEIDTLVKIRDTLLHELMNG